MTVIPPPSGFLLRGLFVRDTAIFAIGVGARTAAIARNTVRIMIIVMFMVMMEIVMVVV
jgi:hypothetical protein